ncbi:MAG: hypothetical protein NT029_13945 [Armatimonadetes bacterium]|nr:hypothetical protein [Armatimonadota bacterium]
MSRAVLWAGAALSITVSCAGAAVDSVDLVSRTSRTAHRVTYTASAPTRRAVAVGATTRDASGLTLEEGGSVRATLRVHDGEGPGCIIVTLATPPERYGKLQCWSVAVAGAPPVLISDRDPGAGVLRSAFFDIPPGVRRPTVEVRRLTGSECPITVQSLCAAPLHAHLTKALSPMAVSFLTPQGSGYSTTIQEMRAALGRVPVSPYLRAQAAVLYNFCIRDTAQNNAEIARLAGMAEQANVPLRIAFQMHWAGAPIGVPDGAGGDFMDLPYQQITYDPADKREAPGLKALLGDLYRPGFGLSVPNRWSDTPWLTMNHPRLNQLRRARLSDAVRAWKQERLRLALSGRARLLPGDLSTGDETVYWAAGVDDSAYTEANGGAARTRLAADFNPYTAADAFRDGVTLDPRDGLSKAEKLWLHGNLARWQQTIVDWMVGALGSEPMRATNDETTYAADLVRLNLYTEPYAMPLYPMKAVSRFRPGLELGYVEGGRSGGEYWSGAQMLPWLLKSRETGRTALPNLECTGAGDDQITACLAAAYCTGARFSTLYNWQHRPGITDVMKRLTRWIEAPYGPAHPAAGAATTGAHERGYTAGLEAYGINRIAFWLAAGTEPPRGLAVTVTDPATGSSVTVPALAAAAGPGPRRCDADLPIPFHQEPGKSYSVRIHWTGAQVVRLAAAADGLPALEATMDLQAERRRSLTLQVIRDAANAVATAKQRLAPYHQPPYLEAQLRAAQRAYEQGDVQEAYTASVRAIQSAIPAAFTVAAPGSRLRPYPLRIECPAGPVEVIINEATPRRTAVQATSASGGQVTLIRGRSRVKAILTPGVSAQLTIVH